MPPAEARRLTELFDHAAARYPNHVGVDGFRSAYNGQLAVDAGSQAPDNSRVRDRIGPASRTPAVRRARPGRLIPEI